MKTLSLENIRKILEKLTKGGVRDLSSIRQWQDCIPYTRMAILIGILRVREMSSKASYVVLC